MHYLKKQTIMYLTLILCLSANIAWGSDFQSPRTAGLGGAGHAAPLLNDSIYLNPSFASFLPTYSLSTNYLLYHGGTPTPDDQGSVHGHNLNVSLQDGRSEMFQAGVGYTQRESTNLLNIGASKSFIKRFGVGLGAKFLFPKSPGVGSARDSVFSASGVINEWFYSSFIIDNLFETPAGKNLGLYREFILGTKINLKGITLVYIDPHLTPDLPGSTTGLEAGLEFVFLQDLFLRLGKFSNSMVSALESRADGWSLGAGWVAPRVSFDYAVQRATGPTPATTHVFGMTMYF